MSASQILTEAAVSGERSLRSSDHQSRDRCPVPTRTSAAATSRNRWAASLRTFPDTHSPNKQRRLASCVNILRQELDVDRLALVTRDNLRRPPLEPLGNHLDRPLLTGLGLDTELVHDLRQTLAFLATSTRQDESELVRKLLPVRAVLVIDRRTTAFSSTYACRHIETTSSLLILERILLLCLESAPAALRRTVGAPPASDKPVPAAAFLPLAAFLKFVHPAATTMTLTGDFCNPVGQGDPLS